MIKNIILHFLTICKHKWIVFKLCIRAGIPMQGFLHDFSKFSPVEFWEGVKYFQGYRSPIRACIEDKGYSKARAHHLNRNKHHPRYWKDRNKIMPYKYVVEMICDQIAAAKTYEKKDWTTSSMRKYWDKYQESTPLPVELKDMIGEIYNKIEKDGIKKVVSKKVMKDAYIRHTNKNNINSVMKSRNI